MGDGYDPRPAEPSPTDLPEELRGLVEAIAQRVHDMWARGRLDEGWTLGPIRSDERREHPCLVPYDELSEAEKDFDRRTALTTVGAILELGWELRPSE